MALRRLKSWVENLQAGSPLDFLVRCHRPTRGPVIDPDANARRTSATRRRCRNGWRVQRDVALASGVDPKEVEALVGAVRGQDRSRDAGDDFGL